MRLKLATAQSDGDTKQVAKIEAQIRQRELVYGIHWYNDGSPNINSNDYCNLDLKFIG